MSVQIPWTMGNEWDDILIERPHGDVLMLIPVDDLIGHEQSADCVCGPLVEPLGAIDLFVGHYALDGRE